MGSKSSPPPAPDYIGQAQAQSAGNLAAARAQTTANRIDQVTPYGNIKYTQGDGFDEAGYTAAMSRYQQMEDSLNSNPNGAMLRQYMSTIGQPNKRPERTDFITNPDHWASQIELSDTGRQLLDADSRARLGLAGLQDQAMGRVGSALATPFDTSGIPGQVYNIDANTGMDSWKKYSDLLQERINPDLERQQAALDTKLANQGLTQGSEGWATGQSAFGKQRNDASIAAQLAGAQLQGQMFDQAYKNAGLTNQGRAQELQTRATLRNMPLNELQALRTGAAVTNPTFSTPGQQGQTTGPDLMGATQAQYGAQVGNVNAQNAATAQTNSAIGSTAVAALAYFF